MDKQNARIVNKLFVQQKVTAIWIKLSVWLTILAEKVVQIAENEFNKERNLYYQLEASKTETTEHNAETES